MKSTLLIAGLLINIAVAAQDKTVKQLSKEASKTITKDPTDTLPHKWRKGGVFTTNLSQGALRNWAAGGDDFSLSVTSLLNLFAFYKEGRRSWDNTADFNFGFVRTTTLGSRKNDDRLDLLSKYGYGLTPKLNVSTLFNFRTQLFKGYSYPNDSTKELSSTFLSPAYALLSLGLDYKPNADFSVFISPITARWIIVKDDSLSAKGQYGVEPGRHSNLEVGAFLSASYIKAFNPVVAYKARLDLFSNYRHNPQNVDVFWTNMQTVKLWKILALSWNVDLIYDDDVQLFGKAGRSPALQLKSIVGVGLLLTFPSRNQMPTP